MHKKLPTMNKSPIATKKRHTQKSEGERWVRGRRTKEREAQREEMQRQEAPWWRREERHGGWLVGVRVRDVKGVRDESEEGNERESVAGKERKNERKKQPRCRSSWTWNWRKGGPKVCHATYGAPWFPSPFFPPPFFLTILQNFIYTILIPLLLYS